MKKTSKVSKVTKIPKVINICGLEHKIVYPYIFKNDSDLLGLYERAQACIKITDMYMNEERPEQGIKETLIHESFHGIDYMVCSNTLDHDILTDLSIGWYQVLKDNNLFSYKSMPKKVRVGGFDYTVEFPYVFEDEDSGWGETNNNSLNLRLSDSDTTGKFPDEFIRQQLIYLVTCAIVGVYCSSAFDALLPFGYGVYQVFKDNKFEKLVKNN